jgi:hypothetical protein
VRAYCDLHGLELAEVLVDAGESGKNLQRRAMRKLLARVRSGRIGAVVITKLDRLTRSPRDLFLLVDDELNPRSVELVSIQEHIDMRTPAGRAAARAADRRAGPPGATSPSGSARAGEIGLHLADGSLRDSRGKPLCGDALVEVRRLADELEGTERYYLEKLRRYFNDEGLPGWFKPVPESHLGFDAALEQAFAPEPPLLPVRISTAG